MNSNVYRFVFPESVPLEEVEATLLLSIMGVESLHGTPQVQLDAGHFLDVERRACVIDANTPAGRDLARLFAGFVLREFGPDSFRVEHPGRTRSMREDSN